jgi:hypothetical protein
VNQADMAWGTNAPADEGAAATQHDALLTVHMFFLLSFNNMLFLEALECKRFGLIIHVLYQLHPAEPPDTQRCYHVQIIQTDVVIFCETEMQQH